MVLGQVFISSHSCVVSLLHVDVQEIAALESLFANRARVVFDLALDRSLALVLLPDMPSQGFRSHVALRIKEYK